MSSKKLPDGEYEIMNEIWDMSEPFTSRQLIERMDHTLPERKLKAQTVQTILVRLEKKGFLTSVKTGRERSYRTLISRHDYLAVERASLKKRFERSSFPSLVKALYDGGDISDDDIKELKEWVDSI